LQTYLFSSTQKKRSSLIYHLLPFFYTPNISQNVFDFKKIIPMIMNLCLEYFL